MPPAARPSNKLQPACKKLSETDRLLKIIDQLKMEKQCLVDSVINLSKQCDEDRRYFKIEREKVMSELTANKTRCKHYEKTCRSLETNITEILRSEINEDGLPVVHDDLVEKCQVMIRESLPLPMPNSSTEDNESDNLDIFIDHLNVSVVIEDKLADGTSGNKMKTSIDAPYDNDITDPSLFHGSGCHKSGSGSSGEITEATIAKLPGKYLLDRKCSINSMGRDVTSDFSADNSTTSRSRLSPSLSLRSNSHVSMDSLRRRSMMETRIRCDDDQYESDPDSVISSISEHGNKTYIKSLQKNYCKKGGRRVCICGAYRSRRERKRPSLYRYFDEDGNLVMTMDGNCAVEKSCEVNNVTEANAAVENEVDSVNSGNTAEVGEASPSEESVEKKNSFNWKWW